MTATVTFLSYHRRKRFRYGWAAGERPPAEVINLPVLPRLIPIPLPGTDAVIVDQVALATLLKNQAILCKDRHFGAKIQMTFRALELLVGEEEANRQVWEIVQEYLDEKQAA